MTSSLGTDIDAYHRPSQLAITITATSPVPVDLTLLNPPSQSDFPPAKSASSPAQRTFRWSKVEGGVYTLAFEARETAPPNRVKRLNVTVHTAPGDDPRGTLVGDVTGDGVLDAVVGASFADIAGRFDVGAIYVWAGGATPSAVPRARLLANGPNTRSLGGGFYGEKENLQLVDVTGDGILDVIAPARVPGFGPIYLYVWTGGPALNGDVAPTARLEAPASFVSGTGFTGYGVRFRDMTGDGTLDLLVPCWAANLNGTAGVGALLLFEGGPSLVGTPGPRAVLAVPGAAMDDQLGRTSFGTSLLLGDVTGDGVEDLIVNSPPADMRSVANAGAIYVWRGGAMNGVVAPIASLSHPAAEANETLRLRPLADVTGDGLLDIVATSEKAFDRRGVVLVWAGGAGLTGEATPSATLRDLSAASGERLGIGGISLGDVTGDGVTDVVTNSPDWDVGGVQDVGALHVWAGGATLTGTPTPVAVLSAPGATARDRLGQYVEPPSSARSHPPDLVDLTGDGVSDILSVCPYYGPNDEGAAFVWRGGGLADPPVKLHAGGGINEHMGAYQSHRLNDLTGDGIPDIVLGTPLARGGAGALYLWRSEAGFAADRLPSAVLHAPGSTALGISTDRYRFTDVTGDGKPDLVALHAQRVFCWDRLTGSGDQGPSSEAAVDPTLFVSRIDLPRFADVNGDGIQDFIGSAPQATIGGVSRVGTGVVWYGGPGIFSTAALHLAVPSPTLNDDVGITSLVLDMTGDGTADVLLGSHTVDVTGVVDAGAAFLLRGDTVLAGAVPPDASLAVPGAQTNDGLGALFRSP